MSYKQRNSLWEIVGNLFKTTPKHPTFNTKKLRITNLFLIHCNKFPTKVEKLSTIEMWENRELSEKIGHRYNKEYEREAAYD